MKFGQTQNKSAIKADDILVRSHERAILTKAEPIS
jgi:hypothetical protein